MIGEFPYPDGKDGMQEALRVLWENYGRSKSAEEKGRLMMAYSHIVRFVVQRFTVSPMTAKSPLEKNDLTQIGMLGLMDAIERYDPARGAKFETYATLRIQGTIQDELRKLDWVPRSDRKKMRDSEDVLHHFENNNGNQSAVSRYAKEHSLSQDDYYSIARHGNALRVEADLHQGKEDVEDIATEEVAEPPDLMHDDELKNKLTAEITKLPRRERLVIVLHYYEGLKFTAIAKVLDLSESRVSQIHAAVIAGLKKQCADLLT
jgi:RNA polymerase sigma factor for flagellar operon FliA